VQDVTGAYLGYQVHPDHAGLVDELMGWYDAVAAGLDRTVTPQAADEFGLKRWAAHGYQSDPASVSDTGSWTQLNERDLIEVPDPVLPDGFRFRSADEAGPEAAVQAHVDAWAPSSYTAAGYEGVRKTASYRGDLHVLVEAPGGTMAASTIMWLDEANKTAEFEPVGTHPGYRRLGLGTAMVLHGIHLARAAGATHMTVACLGHQGIRARAGCTTASGSGSSHGTRRSSSLQPRYPATTRFPSQHFERAAEAARFARAQQGGRLIGGSPGAAIRPVSRLLMPSEHPLLPPSDRAGIGKTSGFRDRRAKAAEWDHRALTTVLAVARLAERLSHWIPCDWPDLAVEPLLAARLATMSPTMGRSPHSAGAELPRRAGARQHRARGSPPHRRPVRVVR
jgi:GNAT superfamily N-acetyltransferase